MRRLQAKLLAVIVLIIYLYFYKASELILYTILTKKLEWYKNNMAFIK